jgi:DNA replication initiation complex subunit (GINS family)
MITYSELYELLRKEKYNEQLQLLSKGFFKEIAEYFQDKKKFTEKTDDIFSDAIIKSKKQYENAIAVLREILTRRQKKVINLALIAAKSGISKRDAENMTESEQVLFETIVKELEAEEKKVDGIISGQYGGKDLKNQLVRFKQDTSEFLDMNENKLGPFKAGDIANISKEIANILINSGNAEVLDES